jgi:probable metal-binding protein
MEQATENSIHGHEVIEMVVASGRAWRREELVEEVERRWGGSARFHTCSAQGMSAAELIRFLSEHGKFLESERGVTMDATKVCDHDD